MSHSTYCTRFIKSQICRFCVEINLSGKLKEDWTEANYGIPKLLD